MDSESPPPPRLEDIAKRVGISRSEVSRVLNNRVRPGRSVSIERQAQIRAVARELGYSPHPGAQNLARGKTDLVALTMLIDSGDGLPPHYQEIITAVTSVFRGHGMNLILSQSEAETQLPSIEKLARSRQTDGVILTDMMLDDQRPGLLARYGLPYVIRGTAPGYGMPAIGLDNIALGRLAVQHLAGYGHRRILFHNVGRNMMAGYGRHIGFVEASTDLGLTSDVEYEDSIYLEHQVFSYAINRWAQPNPPTAVYAADEMAASAFLRAFNELGLRVPTDVSLMCSLNAKYMHQVLPSITKITTQQQATALEAARLLLKSLGRKSVPMEQVFLQPELVQGQSVSAPTH
ncbi:MAG: LacI family DNA-binding transcriptional regulator [Armatimonadota bacterium]